MPLITCPDCNQKVSDRAYHCPHCGFPIREYLIENGRYNGPASAGDDENTMPLAKTTRKSTRPVSKPRHDDDDDDDDEGGRRMKFMDIVIIILMLCVIGGVGYWIAKPYLPSDENYDPWATDSADYANVDSIAQESEIKQNYDDNAVIECARTLCRDLQTIYSRADVRRSTFSADFYRVIMNAFDYDDLLKEKHNRPQGYEALYGWLNDRLVEFNIRTQDTEMVVIDITGERDEETTTHTLKLVKEDTSWVVDNLDDLKSKLRRDVINNPYTSPRRSESTTTGSTEQTEPTTPSPSPEEPAPTTDEPTTTE